MLHLQDRLLRETLAMMVECGQGRCECVNYWTGPLCDTEIVDGWVHPTHQRLPYGYQIDDGWLTRYWFQLARKGRAIRAQVHSHPSLAFHSQIDDHWSVVSQPGFISIVVPNFAIGTNDLNEMWAGILTVNGEWKNIPVNAVLEITP